MLLNILTLISAVSFLYYGITFFSNSGMKEEFERYGLNKFREFIGYLQLLGGLGLLVGLFSQPILIISSGGLSLLMMIGFGVRLKMKDALLLCLPSFIFMIINFYICVQAIQIS
ncbi:DoxX family protein [Arcticibacter eurypsychrophilus]|uniref:DoxX family protein n=1 Tax=Arcticibacter eurypsychrophilus TaxID=1434752 RepID=UPI00084E03FF|nr:DoxX family protein [Arcticibacter eurypsychrophilus]